MIVDDTAAKVNSQLIVDLCMQALENLKAPQIVSMKRNMPRRAFREDFGTVRIFLPRRSGHSTAALQLLCEHPDALLFVTKHSRKDDMQNMIRDYTSNQALRDRINNAIVPLSPNALTNLKPVEYRSFVIFDGQPDTHFNVYAMFKETVSVGIVVELH